MRLLFLSLILPGLLWANAPPLPEPLPPPLPPRVPGRVMHVVPADANESPRLILPADLFDPAFIGHFESNETPPVSPVLAGLALAVAAVLFGFHLLGRKVPVRRLAFGASLTVLLVAGFSGCGAGQTGDVELIHTPPTPSCRPLALEMDRLLGEVYLERGEKDAEVWFIVPPEKLRDLAQATKEK